MYNGLFDGEMDYLIVGGYLMIHIIVGDYLMIHLVVGDYLVIHLVVEDYLMKQSYHCLDSRESMNHDPVKLIGKTLTNTH